MAGHTVELRHQDSDRLCPWRDVDIEQLFDGKRETQLVVERRQVVHAGDVGAPLHVRQRLRGLLHPGMEVADDRLGAEDRLSIELELEPQHTVGGGVLRAQVEDLQFIAPETGRLAVVVDDRHAALSSQPRVELAGKQLLGPLVGCGRHPIGFLGACDPEVVDPSALLCPMRPPVRGLLVLRLLVFVASGIVAHRVALNSTGTEPIR